MHRGNALDALHRTAQSGTASYFVPPTILKAEGLVKIYGKRRVVDGVSFHVNKGEIVGLLGPNGAGKSTSFLMTCGLISSNGGIVYLGAHDVTNWPMYRRSREGGMGYLPQDRSVFQKLTVQNNLLGVMELLGIKRPERKRRCDELLEKFRLTHLRNNFGGGLSGGERRRLEIARALVSEPKIILLDEPFAAIDPITVTGIQEIVRQLSEEGISILITDHSVKDTLEITHRSYVIEAGKVLCHGTPAEVLSNPAARKAYFGENVSVGNLQSGVLSFQESGLSGLSQGQGHSIHMPGFETSAEREKKHEKHEKRHRKSDSSFDDDFYDDVQNTSRLHAERSVEKPVGAKPAEAKIEIRPDVGTSAVLDPPTPLPNSEIQTRALGKRLTPTPSGVRLPERPLVRSNSSEAVADATKATRISEKPALPDEPAAGMSGIIRNLGSLIWKK